MLHRCVSVEVWVPPGYSRSLEIFESEPASTGTLPANRSAPERRTTPPRHTASGCFPDSLLRTPRRWVEERLQATAVQEGGAASPDRPPSEACSKLADPSFALQAVDPARCHRRRHRGRDCARTCLFSGSLVPRENWGDLSRGRCEGRSLAEPPPIELILRARRLALPQRLAHRRAQIRPR